MFNPNVVTRNIVNRPVVNDFVALLGRFLIAYIFIVAGWGKVIAYSATAGYMENMGVSASLLPTKWCLFTSPISAAILLKIR